MQNNIQEIWQHLRARAPTIAPALPASLPAERMIRTAMMAIAKNPQLGECDPQSIWWATAALGILGLEPVAGAAYLVPFRDKKNNRTICQPIIGYQGMIELALRSKMVTSIEARIIYEGDEYDIQYGTSPRIMHRPKFTDRGRPILIYAVAHMRDNGEVFVVFSAEEIERKRHRSQTPDAGPWVTDWEEMAKKTAIRSLCKYLPKSPEMATATEIEDDAELAKMVVANVCDDDISGAIAEGRSEESQTEKLKNLLRYSAKKEEEKK